jgi:hypothetical protein
MKLLVMQFVTSSLFSPDIPLSNLFSNTLSPLMSHSLDSQLKDGSKVVSPMYSAPQKHYFSTAGTNLLLNKPQGLVQPEGLGKLKKNSSPSQISNLRPSGL